MLASKALALADHAVLHHVFVCISYAIFIVKRFILLIFLHLCKQQKAMYIIGVLDMYG